MRLLSEGVLCSGGSFAVCVRLWGAICVRKVGSLGREMRRVICCLMKGEGRFEFLGRCRGASYGGRCIHGTWLPRGVFLPWAFLTEISRKKSTCTDCHKLLNRRSYFNVFFIFSSITRL